MYSEEDFEKALGAYAKQSHSSTIFLDSSTKPTLAAPTSSVPAPSDSTRASRNLPGSDHTRLIGGRSEGTTTAAAGGTPTTGSAVSSHPPKASQCQENTVSEQSVDSEETNNKAENKENCPPPSTAPSQYVWLEERDDTLTLAQPRYSRDMPLITGKVSPDELTQSLQSASKVSSTNHAGKGRARTASSMSRLAPHKRSLSVQSLASNASSIDSGNVRKCLSL